MKTNPLRAWRHANKKKALDVAIKLGVSEQSVLQYERGAFKPSPSNFALLAELMSEDLSKLHLSWTFWEKANRGA